MRPPCMSCPVLSCVYIPLFRKHVDPNNWRSEQGLWLQESKEPEGEHPGFVSKTKKKGDPRENYGEFHLSGLRIFMAVSRTVAVYRSRSEKNKRL